MLVTARQRHGFCHFLLFSVFLFAGYYFRLHTGEHVEQVGNGGSRGGSDIGQVLEFCHTLPRTPFLQHSVKFCMQSCFHQNTLYMQHAQ